MIIVYLLFCLWCDNHALLSFLNNPVTIIKVLEIIHSLFSDSGNSG